MKYHRDIFAKFSEAAGYFGALRLSGDDYYCNPVLSPSVKHTFKYENRPTISWSLNNYLGLANHKDINNAAAEALNTYGISSPMGSRMLTGTTLEHLELETLFADFARKESSYLFNYGYLGVLGTICSLVGRGDVIIIDKLTHSCMVDAALLSQATVRIFKHNNMVDLEKQLKRINMNRKGGVLIAVEGVYGMTGDIANLKAISELARTYEARLFVDDAHGWGVMGKNGVGSGEFFGVHDAIDLYFGTFAKSFAAIGGVTITTKAARDWIAFNARTQIFAKSLPIIYVSALRKALELVKKSDARRQSLWKISNLMKQHMHEIGYFVGDGESPICPIFLALHAENPERVGMRLMRWLRDRGIFVSAVAYPVIPRDMLMFRIVPTAAHTISDVQQTVEIFKKMRDEHSLHTEMSKEEIRRLNRIYHP